MAHGNKYSYPHKTKDPPKKILKGLFLPRLTTNSEPEETRGVSRDAQGGRLSQHPARRGASSERWEAARRQRSSRPGCHPSLHTTRCKPRAAAPRGPRCVPLTAPCTPGWCVVGRGELCTSANPPLHMGAVKGPPPERERCLLLGDGKRAFHSLTELSPTIL